MRLFVNQSLLIAVYVYLPRSLQSAETRLRQIATQELVRGKANVNVELTSKKEAEQSVSIN
ncbi:MAG: hypothetical protein LAT68_12900, partial [Cyclobacteriaceae bacterium]|nr:hypothetical protein [Cyclobacteriaceae bacterium]